MAKAKAMVVGCNGQDGVFLVRELSRRGYFAVGVAKQPEPRDVLRGLDFAYEACDIAVGDALGHVLRLHGPELIFYVAAVHASASAQAYEQSFGRMLMVNVRGVHEVLEYQRAVRGRARLVYASSGKIFGTPFPPRIHLGTPRKLDCLYSVTKASATDLIAYYRNRHGVAASVLHLFNHESEFRGPDFFVGKIARCLATARSMAKPEVDVETLDFFCDWGSAEEYMSLAVDVAERGCEGDAVVATGRTVHARELVDVVFQRFGRLRQDHVRERQPGSRGQAYYEVDCSSLERLAGRTPSVPVEAIIERMVAACEVCA